MILMRAASPMAVLFFPVAALLTHSQPSSFFCVSKWSVSPPMPTNEELRRLCSAKTGTMRMAGVVYLFLPIGLGDLSDGFLSVRDIHAL